METREQHLWIAIVIALLVLVLFGGAGMMGLGNYSGYRGMMNYGYGMMGGSYGYGLGGMWIFGGLIMTLVVVVLVLAMLWLIKQLQEPERRRK